jgi:uncharacterized protein (UPF0210 family)
VKIRSIAIGISGVPSAATIRSVGVLLARAEEEFARRGYEVQSRRIVMDHWDLGLQNMPMSDRGDLLESIDASCGDAHIAFCSLGMARAPEDIGQIASLIARTRYLYASADIGDRERGTNMDAIQAAAQAIQHLASSTSGGIGNFRFGAGSCLGPGTPFFPGAFHDGGRSSFSIGLENSDLLVNAFSQSSTLDQAGRALDQLLTEACQRVVSVAEAVSSMLDLPFRGLDTSIAPSLEPAESITLAFDAIGVRFGDPGTLAVCSAITKVLKAIPVPQVGYCGIMLPVLEDMGLAAASAEQRFGITSLLAYSSVCAVGVDMVPIPGDCSTTVIEHILLDLATLSVKLAKPLLARLLPVHGKNAGDRTEFNSVFMCNGTVMKV